MQCTSDRPQRRRTRRSKTSLSSIPSTEPGAEHEIGHGPSRITAVTSHRSSQEELVETQSLHTSISATPSIPIPTVSSGSTTLIEGLQRVGSRQVLELMIKDYLNLLYPLMPIVHRPNFRDDVARERGDHDPVFYSLLLSICAIVVSQLPRRFLDYKRAQWVFDFDTPKQLVLHLEERVRSLRSQDYFETPTTEKCAIAFFLACSYGCLNAVGRMSMYWAEMWVMLWALGANDAQTYIGLNCVEAQLRKKAFWLYVFHSVHERVGGPQRPSLLWKPIPDQMLFDSEQLETLLPLDLDDEYITPDSLYQQPASETSLTTGFIGLIHIFLCLVDLPDEVVGKGGGNPKIRLSSPPEARNPADHYADRRDYKVLRRMFERVKYILEDISPQMALWQRSDRTEAEPDHGHDGQEQQVTRSDQLESMRANLQVTRLWVRSLIFERLLAIYHASSSLSSSNTNYTSNSSSSTSSDELQAQAQAKAQAHEREHWAERQSTCEQLLSVLSNIRQKTLEPNGIALTYKIRQVAATLLLVEDEGQEREDCRRWPLAYEEGEQQQHTTTSMNKSISINTNTRISRRRGASLYVERFVELLTLLDEYSFQDTQMVVWR